MSKKEQEDIFRRTEKVGPGPVAVMGREVWPRHWLLASERTCWALPP